MEFYIEKIKPVVMKNFVSVLLTQYADFKGKTNYADYSRYMAIWGVALAVVNIVFTILSAVLSIFSIFSLLALLGTVVPTVAIAVRRLRDAKISPWCLLWILTIIGILYVTLLLRAESEK